MNTNAISSATSSVQQMQQPHQTRQAQAAQFAEGAEKPKLAQAQQPRPVTNPQGQLTGTVINTTA